MTQVEFLKMVEPFKDKVFRLAKRLLVSREEAEDATQEILIKLWNNKNQIEQYRNIEAFSMTMTKNLCFDKLKSKHSQNLKIIHNNYKDNHITLQNEIELKNSVDWVAKLMEDLPDQQKIVMQLRDIEQYEFNEISKMLNIKEATIRVSLSIARKTLRNKLIKVQSYGVG